MNIDEIMKEIAEYVRLQEEVMQTLDSLKDTVKQYMEQNGLDTLAGTEHKATYKPVTSSRIDTAAKQCCMEPPPTQHNNIGGYDDDCNQNY